MVYANKAERQREKQVVSFMVEKVLNHGGLTKITGITTKKDFQDQDEAQKQEKIRVLQRQQQRFESELRKTEKFALTT